MCYLHSDSAMTSLTNTNANYSNMIFIALKFVKSREGCEKKEGKVRGCFSISQGMS